MDIFSFIYIVKRRKIELEIASKYTKKFESDGLTKQKYKDIYNLAVLLRDHKNLVSNDIVKDLDFYLEMGKFEFQQFFERKYRFLCLSSNFERHVYTHVYTCYQSKFEVIKRKMKFEMVSIKEKICYKRNTKTNKVGQLKEIKYKKHSTDLTCVLSFLARYSNETIFDYINEQLKDAKLIDSKRKLFENTLLYIAKFGKDRIINLASQKRENVINRYSNPIVFNSLSFSGRSRKKDIISHNKNANSIKDTFISLSWTEPNSCMEIPVKYSRKHFGDISLYHKKTNDYEYTITFTNKHKVCVNLCIDGVREIHVNDLVEDKMIGIDVNIKNNLFVLSDGKSFDFNREIISNICDILKDIDGLKAKDKNYKVGKKKQKLLDSLRNKHKKMTEGIVFGVCKYLINSGVNHIVMENLTNSFGKTYAKNDEDINYNRYVKELRLCSMKDIMERISVKYGISTSLVQPEYTSKMCSKCGCIHDENRLTQEDFACVYCGFSVNADFNAAINIKNRVGLTVLRNLLKQNAELNTFRPKVIKREDVKKYLVKAFPSSQVDRRGLNGVDVVNMYKIDHV